MAEDPDVRDLMRRMGASYVHVNELAGLFCRELFVSPADDDWVMFMRTLPSVKTARLDDMPRPSPNGVAGWRLRGLQPRGLSHDRGDLQPGHPPGTTRGLQDLFPGEGSLDRGSPALDVRQASPGLSRHVSGDIHGSRPDPVPLLAGARSPPGAIPGHDPMSSRRSAVFPGSPAAGSATAFRRYCARSLWRHRRSPPRED